MLVGGCSSLLEHDHRSDFSRTILNGSSNASGRAASSSNDLLAQLDADRVISGIVTSSKGKRTRRNREGINLRSSSAGGLIIAKRSVRVFAADGCRINGKSDSSRSGSACIGPVVIEL